MIKQTLLTLLLIFAGHHANIVAQHEHIPLPTEHRVSIGGEFVPRFAHLLPNSLIVPAGQTVTLPADATYDAIEVAGTLRCDRAVTRRLKVTHLLILAGGVFDCGTVASPMPSMEIIIRDVPLDLARDPFQWGNGILNFGTQTRVGRAVERAFTEVIADPQAGSTTLNVASIPAGWLVGDEVVLPDMNPPAEGPRRETGVTITAIAGSTLTLSKPLTFSRQTVRRVDGTVIVRPRVANLTRSFVVRSENPAGTRGHTANVGAGASWDIRGNQFIGVGRTKAEDLNLTAVDMMGVPIAIGTNQIAKYATHDHHTGSSLAVRNTIGNSFHGTGGSKWAHVVHGTHDVVSEDNVCIDFQGGCFVTEDGYESRNVFRRNVAAYSTVLPGVNPDAAVLTTAPRNNPGGEGSGFWFRGIHNVIEGNESWNNVTGINLFNQAQISITNLIPSVKGGKPDTPFNRRTMVPISFTDNVTIGNSLVGLEYWATPLFYAEDHISVNNLVRQIWAATSVGISVGLKNVQTWGGDTGVAGDQGYVGTMEVIGGYVGGSRLGFPFGMAGQRILLKNLTLENTSADIQLFGAGHHTYDSLRFLSPSMNWIATIGTPSTAPTWQPGQPLPEGYYYGWMKQNGVQTVLKNYNGTGQSYALYGPHQARSLPVPSADPAYGEWWFAYPPEAGLTNGQAWDKFCMANGGATFADGTAAPLEGVNTGSLAAPLGDVTCSPRGVVTWPNMIHPVPSGGTGMLFYLVATGVGPQGVGSEGMSEALSVADWDLARTNVVFSVDGGQDFVANEAMTGAAPRVFRVYLNDPALATDGLHSVVACRQDLAGVKIPSSCRTYPYRVGASTPPPPAVAPTIDAHPASLTIDSGKTATLTVTASGTAPLSYQWLVQQGASFTAILNATADAYTTPALTAQATYRVRVTNAQGSVESTSAVVTVTAPPPPPPPPPTGVTWTTVFWIQRGSDGSVRLVPAP